MEMKKIIYVGNEKDDLCCEKGLKLDTKKMYFCKICILIISINCRTGKTAMEVVAKSAT